MFINCNLRHPRHYSGLKDWSRWRQAYEGGREFIYQHLIHYSQREGEAAFIKRRSIAYCPRFAGAAIDDVKNSIYQRMSDISRVGGPKSYQDAVILGVDDKSQSMNFFVGQDILPELLVTARVGVYVDAPQDIGPTLASNFGKRPYLIPYWTDNILNWNDGKSSLLLQNLTEDCDENTGLTKTKPRKTFRFFRLVREGVEVYDVNTVSNSKADIDVKPSFLLRGFTRIPFVEFELNKSLMEDICEYQIALMNLCSSDIGYILQANFPFYIEQFDPRFENPYQRASTATDADGTVTPNVDQVKQISIGTSNGRRYAVGTNPPQFIHPSTEPLMASIQKEEQIKTEIRHLLNLTLSNIAPKFASAESKNMDQRSLEAGLAAIGMVLENGEREIAEVWSMYDTEGGGNPATINYPRNYSLKSDSERREEADADSKLMTAVPSKTYRKEIAKRITTTMIGHLIPYEILTKIHSEIDNAKYTSSNPSDIKIDSELGLVSDETASSARGYANGEVDQAKKDRAERIKLTQVAQMPANGVLDNPGARGVKDLVTDPNAAIKEKAIAATS